ncbi:MAG TPA: hypothetical protein VGJ92_04715 [Methanocella sp.]|jgi:hypothetical protein
MKAVFKVSLLALLLLITLSPLVHADNLPAPLLNDPRFSYMGATREQNITLIYNPESVPDYLGVMTTAKDVHDEIDEFFGGFPYTTTIVVAGKNSEFRLFVNVGDAPDTAKALNWNVGYNGLIITKSPAMLPDFKEALKHQMARIAVRTRETNYKSLPEWYQDGVASVAAGDLTQDQRVAVSMKAVTGQWMSLEDIERAYRNMTIYNYDVQQNRDARAQAAALVDKMSIQFGSKALVEIIDDYTEDGNLTQAFVNRTTFTPDSLNLAYMNSLSGGASASPVPTAGATATVKPGNSTKPAPSPTAVPGNQDSKNTGNTVATETASAWSLPATGDILLYGSIAVVNAIGVIAVLIILRRNWH